MFRRRNFIEDDKAIATMVIILICGLVFSIISGLFFMWAMSMLPQIGIGVLYIAIAIAIVIGVANISKSMLNKTLPKSKRSA